MANKKMMDIVDLAIGANAANNILTMPSFSSIQQRNRVLRDERAQAQALEDLNNPWLAEQRSFGEASQYEDYKPLYNMDGFRPMEEPPVVTDVPKEPTVDNLGGMGGDMRSPSNLVTADTTNYNLGVDVPAATQEQGVSSGVDEQKKAEIEASANNSFSIDELLNKLHELGSLQPGDNREQLFQLDTVYKGSSPEYGIVGSPAEHPTIDYKAQNNFNMGYPQGME